MCRAIFATSDWYWESGFRDHREPVVPQSELSDVTSNWSESLAVRRFAAHRSQSPILVNVEIGADACVWTTCWNIVVDCGTVMNSGEFIPVVTVMDERHVRR